MFDGIEYFDGRSAVIVSAMVGRELMEVFYWINWETGRTKMRSLSVDDYLGQEYERAF